MCLKIIIKLYRMNVLEYLKDDNYDQEVTQNVKNYVDV